MTDDLVKRLRETTHMYQVDCELKMKCVDRIEELEAENADLKDKLVEALLRIPCPYDDATYQYDEFCREREAAIAKLTGGKDE